MFKKSTALLAMLFSGILSGTAIAADRIYDYPKRDESCAIDSEIVYKGGIEIPKEYSDIQKTLVIMFNFMNDNREPFTEEQVYDAVFNDSSSMNRYYEETSYRKITFAGHVIGWYTIGDDNLECKWGLWAKAADECAMEDGIDVNNYDRIIYLFPKSSSCLKGGLGSPGPLPTRSWNNGNNSPGVYAHEMGHNLGMSHAMSIDCGDKQIDDYVNCTFDGYGDWYDVMGQMGRPYHLNAPHKTQMGWLDAESVIDVTSEGVYRIDSPIETPVPGVKVLRIAKPDTNEFYYVEYRRPLGFDVYLRPPITEGALIHIGGSLGNDPSSGTKLVDATPHTKRKGGGYFDESLADGMTFYDFRNRISITQLYHDSDSVTVDVQLPRLPLPPIFNRPIKDVPEILSNNK